MDVNPQTVPAAPQPAVNDPTHRKASGGQWGLASLILKVVLAVLVLRAFVFAPFSIPSESMLPRLWTGDTLIAQKWAYGYSRYSLPFNAPLIPGRIFSKLPERGDIVIFKHPVDKQDYVKRVIGLPGDRVGMMNGQIILNGEQVEREAIADFLLPLSANTGCSGGTQVLGEDNEVVCRFARFSETLPSGAQYEVLDIGPSFGDTYEAIEVPEGQLFLLGDHRDRSMDSRFEPEAGLGIGLVPQENLVGRAGFIIWSSNGGGEWLKPWTWFSGTRTDRIGTGLSSVERQ